jgi:hypothetical protein
MAKSLLSMEDLQWRALKEIRKQPGCSSVVSIAINRVTDGHTESNWSLCVVSAGAADPNTAAREADVVCVARSRASAALTVQHALRRNYDLMTD